MNTWEPIKVKFRRGWLAGQDFTVLPDKLTKAALRRVLECGVRTIIADQLMFGTPPEKVFRGAMRRR